MKYLNKNNNWIKRIALLKLLMEGFINPVRRVVIWSEQITVKASTRPLFPLGKTPASSSYLFFIIKLLNWFDIKWMEKNVFRPADLHASLIMRNWIPGGMSGIYERRGIALPVFNSIDWRNNDVWRDCREFTDGVLAHFFNIIKVKEGNVDLQITVGLFSFCFVPYWQNNVFNLFSYF